MKRNRTSLIAFVFAGLIAAILVTPILAADSSVYYEGGAEKFVFVPGDGNLFPNFAGVMPGDSLTQTITVHNTVNAKDGVKLYLRAASTDETTEGFLEQMTLTVKQGEQLLSADTADKTSGLTENVLLGEFTGAGDIFLKVTLDVPLEMDNRFQNAAGKLVWIFTAEELDPANSSGGNTGNGNRESSSGSGTITIGDVLTTIGDGDTPLANIIEPVLGDITIPDALVPLVMLPKTGDTANLAFWLLLMTVSGSGLGVLILLHKHSRDRK